MSALRDMEKTEIRNRLADLLHLFTADQGLEKQEAAMRAMKAAHEAIEAAISHVKDPSRWRSA